MATFDVIIIGGRNAGASLALRLSRHKLKILLVDRATFPSLPNVPSSPIIHPATMRIMDELGIPESDYAYPDGKIEHYIFNFTGYFEAFMPTSVMQLDRSYTVGTDRNKFDTALWNHAAKADGVTACDNFGVTQILKDSEGNVIGIKGKNPGGEDETFTADLVVGADGRFSLTAREVGAKVIEEINEYISASYHAEWENVEDYAPGYAHANTIYFNAPEKIVCLTIPINTRKYIIGIYMQAVDPRLGTHSIETIYQQALQGIPHLANRLKNARQMTELMGVRKIENGYREAYGRGWALVGDAFHYKDPIDGQGIYDALLEAKILEEAVVDWKQNGKPWMEAGASYQQRAIDAIRPMMLQTTFRIKQQMYTPVPPVIAKTYLRWMMNDPEYQTQFLKYIARDIAPQNFNVDAGISPKIILRGLAGDIRKRFARA